MGIAQTIAMLCQIHAGDTHEYLSTVDEILWSQMKCHSFYSKCLKKKLKSFEDCMVDRLEQARSDLKKAEKVKK